MFRENAAVCAVVCLPHFIGISATGFYLNFFYSGNWDTLFHKQSYKQSFNTCNNQSLRYQAKCSSFDRKLQQI